MVRISSIRHGLTVFTYDSNRNLLPLANAKSQGTTDTYGNMDWLT